MALLFLKRYFSVSWQYVVVMVHYLDIVMC